MDNKKPKHGDDGLTITGTNAIKTVGRGPGYNELTGTAVNKGGPLDP